MTDSSPASQPNGRLKLVIVGGGTAGWMTAALLAYVTEGKLADIVLVESEDIGTIGVGEATIPAIKRFNRLLDIDEADFVLNTKATYKLGILFIDWGRIGTRYFHPFGAIGAPIGRTEFQHFLTRRRMAGLDEDFASYSLNCQAAANNRFVPPPPGVSAAPGLNYAYHFDAHLYARYLRAHAEKHGVRRIEGKIKTVEQNVETGFVESVSLENGSQVSGDFFVDCSGMVGLLIEKTLKTGFEDWSAFLPCDRAVFAPTARVEPVTPYTRSTASAAGWQWRIPLQHRIGNGHVFCSTFMSEEAALESFVRNLDGPPLAEPKFLRFQTGKRKLAWNRNVVAIGLSSGFLEPLESTSIHLIHSGIVKLLDFWPDRNFSPLLAEQYNRAMSNQFEGIRDFIILHYKATDREDTPFWAYCKAMPVPDSLAYKMEHFQASSRIVLTPGELFQPTSWLAVMLGQHLTPAGYDPMADLIADPEIDVRFGAMRAVVDRAVRAMPRHETYLASLAGSPQPN